MPRIYMHIRESKCHLLSCCSKCHLGGGLVAVIWWHWWRCFSSLFFGVAVVFTTAPLKPSPQTQFILEQMTDHQAGVVDRLDRILVDALSTHVDQLQVQVHLNTDVVDHVVHDQETPRVK